MSLRIPQQLLPTDGRFGSGPAKIRPEALGHLMEHAELLGTSHRQAPVRNLVGRVQDGLRELYNVPESHDVVLGNGGATQVWDMAVFSLIERRSAHGVYGEFTRKFASAVGAAPHLDAPLVTEAPAGSAVLPEPGDADVVAWAQNETSTGASADVRRIGEGLVLIDATSAAGAMPADISQTDLYYFAPQKNFSSDGGLWLAFASTATRERAERIKTSGRWLPATLDFSQALANSRQHQTLNTPAIATLLLLDGQLSWLLAGGGLDFAHERVRASSGLLYSWAERHPLAKPFADPDHRSPVVVTIDFDDSVEAARLCQVMRANGIVDIEPYRGVGRNQIRIGVYTCVDTEDVAALVNCLDFVLERLSA